jgi:hypothetical protein
MRILRAGTVFVYFPQYYGNKGSFGTILVKDSISSFSCSARMKGFFVWLSSLFDRIQALSLVRVATFLPAGRQVRHKKTPLGFVPVYTAKLHPSRGAWDRLLLRRHVWLCAAVLGWMRISLATLLYPYSMLGLVLRADDMRLGCAFRQGCPQSHSIALTPARRERRDGLARQDVQATGHRRFRCRLELSQLWVDRTSSGSHSATYPAAFGDSSPAHTSWGIHRPGRV